MIKRLVCIQSFTWFVAHKNGKSVDKYVKWVYTKDVMEFINAKSVFILEVPI